MSINGYTSIDHSLCIDDWHIVWIVCCWSSCCCCCCCYCCCCVVTRRLCCRCSANLNYIYMCVCRCCVISFFVCCLFTSCSLARSRAFSSNISRSLAVNRRHWRQTKCYINSPISLLLFVSYLVTNHSTHFTEWNAWIVFNQTFSWFTCEYKISTRCTSWWSTAITFLLSNKSNRNGSVSFVIELTRLLLFRLGTDGEFWLVLLLLVLIVLLLLAVSRFKWFDWCSSPSTLLAWLLFVWSSTSINEPSSINLNGPPGESLILKFLANNVLFFPARARAPKFLFLFF